MAAKLTAVLASECLFANFLSKIEPKKVSEALKHPGWVDDMQEELNQFYRYKVWTYVPLPYGKTAIGSKWEEGIDYDETFAPVARIEAIMTFLAFATYMNFKFYQMDVKSAFQNGKLKEEVYIKQPPGFKSSEFPDYVCKLDKALYGLKQPPKACSSVKTPMVPSNNFGLDLAGKPVNETSYIGMIGSLMYLTATRPNIQFFIVLCALISTDTQTMLVVIWIEKAPQVSAKYLVENWEFWYMAIAYHPNLSTDEDKPRPLKEFLIKFTVTNGKKPLTFNFNTFTTSTGLDYNNGAYVAHPSLEAVLDGNYSSTKQVNFIQQLITYSLITGTKVDIGEIIYSDMVTKLLNKSRLRYVSYPRFILCALEVLLGLEYTQDKKFGHKDSVSPLSLSTKIKKWKTQTATPTLPKSQGPEASGALSKKRKQPKPKNTPSETKPVDKGLPSTASNEGTVKTTPHLKGPLENEDSGGNKPPDDMELINLIVADPPGTGDKYQAKSSTSMAWNLGPKMTVVEGSQAEIRSEISSLKKDTSDIKSMMTEIYQSFKGQSLAHSSSVPQTILAITEEPANVEGDNVTQADTKEPPSHTKGEHAAIKEEPTNAVPITTAKTTKIPTLEDPMTSLGKRYKRLKKIPKELGIHSALAASVPGQVASYSSRRKRKHMELEFEIKLPRLECNRIIPDGIPFVNNMVIEEPEYAIFFTEVFGDQAF
nr:retrovirus-related Pol polyprotein from transposon TNT 1-94 [Tanacetum cinerariifolium]